MTSHPELRSHRPQDDRKSEDNTTSGYTGRRTESKDSKESGPNFNFYHNDSHNNSDEEQKVEQDEHLDHMVNHKFQ